MALVEVYTNNATTTVTTGGTTAPASGTSETWTVASSTSFASVTSGVNQLHVADPAFTSEIIAVTNISGTTWTVTRGSEGSTPVAHSSGFTIYQVVTAGYLTSPVFSGAVSTGGLTGAVAASRYAGATSSGSPTSGTFVVGDFVIDQTGKIWICTVAGTPGTWANVSPPLPLTTLGDTLYENATPTPTRLAGNTSTTKNFLTQTGTGSASAAPSWGLVQAADLAATANKQGFSQLTLNPDGSVSWGRPWQFYVDAYGAKGDGKQALVTVASGSAVVNTTPQAAPAAPTVSNAATGGTILAGVYGVIVTYVNQWGETVGSTATTTTTTGSTSTITTNFPAFASNVTGWNAYVTQPGGSTYYLQTTSAPLPIGQNLVLTAPPVTGTANPPASNTTAARVFTSTAVDAGKNIMVCGARGTPGGPWVDTIVSVQSATQATLTTATPTVNQAGCAMVFSSDDRLAIDNCVSAAQAYAVAGNWFAQVVFSNKIYGLGTGLFQSSGANGTAGLGYNTQVRIPVGNSSEYTQQLEIQFVGPGDNPGDNTNVNHWMSQLAGIAGTSLVSYSVGPSTADATYGQQSIIGGPNTGNSNFAGGSNGFFNVQAVVKGIQTVQPGYSNSIGMDFQWLGGCTVRGSCISFAPRWDAGGAVNSSRGWVADSFWQGLIGIGMRLPNNLNNDDISIESFSCVGITQAISCKADHVNIGYLQTYNNGQGIVITGADINTHDLTVAHWSYGNLAGTGNALNCQAGSGHITVNLVMDGETNSIGNDIRDTANVLYGQVLWSDPFRPGGSPQITGASHLKVINAQLGPGHMATPPTVPATGVNASLVWRDAWVSIHTGAGVTVSAITIDGTATGLTMAASSSQAVLVPSGKTISVAYAGGTPTWDWWLT